MEIAKNTESVEALAGILVKNNLGSLTYKTDKLEITVEAKGAVAAVSAVPAVVAGTVAEAASVSAAAAPAVSGNVVKSAIVGTFYASPAPDKPAFVKIGDTVKKGDVLFIIESMKLMNEITSDFDGKVAEVYVASGNAVEFDQAIMRIE